MSTSPGSPKRLLRDVNDGNTANKFLHLVQSLVGDDHITDDTRDKILASVVRNYIVQGDFSFLDMRKESSQRFMSSY
jgi:hypothetical protein